MKIYALLYDEIKLFSIKNYNVLLISLFFLLISLFFPLVLGSQINLLSQININIFWIAILFTLIFSLDYFLKIEQEDNTLELLFLIPIPFETFILLKCILFWILHIVPILIISPFTFIILQINKLNVFLLLSTLVISTPLLTLFGIFFYSLILNLYHKAIILTILMIPISLPFFFLNILLIKYHQIYISIYLIIIYICSFIFLVIFCLYLIPLLIKKVIKTSLYI